MLIRPALAQDVPALLPMVRQLTELHREWDPAKYDYLPRIEEMYEPWMRGKTTDPRAVFFVAQRENHGPVGFIIGTIEREIPIDHLREYGFIHDLWVEPAYRNEGIARQLVMSAIERYTQLGVKQIRLDTATKNDPARNLFTSCGFTPSNIELLLQLPTSGN